MTLPVAWRPPCRRDLDKARELVDGALVEWQARWLGRICFVIDDATHLPDTGKRVGPADSNGLHADFAPDASCLLLEAAYATPADVYRSPACHESLRAISVDILDDLTDTLGSALRSPDETDASTAPTISPAYPDGAVRLIIATNDGAAFCTLMIDVRHVRARDRINASSSTAMKIVDSSVARRDALDATVVALSVMLGRCELSVAALSILAIGDVIALDQPLNASIPLIVDATDRPIALGTPGRTGSSLSIQLTSIVTPQSP